MTALTLIQTGSLQHALDSKRVDAEKREIETQNLSAKIRFAVKTGFTVGVWRSAYVILLT